MIRTLAVALLFAFPLSAQDCKDVLPHDLNLGLPRIASGEARVLEPALSKVFGALYAQRKAPSRCPKGMQINVAVGNDYQMLEWLDQKLLVEQMKETANNDLRNRIGIVESWGQPAFSFNVDLPSS